MAVVTVFGVPPEMQCEVTVADIIERMSGRGVGHFKQIEDLKNITKTVDFFRPIQTASVFLHGHFREPGT